MSVVKMNLLRPIPYQREKDKKEKDKWEKQFNKNLKNSSKGNESREEDTLLYGGLDLDEKIHNLVYRSR